MVKVTEHGPGVLKSIQGDIRDIKGPMSFLERIKLFFYIATALVVLGFLLVVALIVYMARRGRARRAAGGEGKLPVTPVQAQVATGPKEDALKALGRGGIRPEGGRQGVLLRHIRGDTQVSSRRVQYPRHRGHHGGDNGGGQKLYPCRLRHRQTARSIGRSGFGEVREICAYGRREDKIYR